MAWLTVQEGLPRTWVRPAVRTLEAVGVEVRVDDGRLQVRDTPEARWALATAEEFEDLNDRIRGVAHRKGRPAIAYKPLERHVLVAALLRSGDGEGADAWARICHEVIWAQGLPNANHRTTLFWLQRHVVPPGSLILDPDGLEEESDAYFADSKALIHEREHRPNQEQLKSQHLRRSQEFINRWVARIQPPGQSR